MSGHTPTSWDWELCSDWLPGEMGHQIRGPNGEEIAYLPDILEPDPGSPPEFSGCQIENTKRIVYCVDAFGSKGIVAKLSRAYGRLVTGTWPPPTSKWKDFDNAMKDVRALLEKE